VTESREVIVEAASSTYPIRIGRGLSGLIAAALRSEAERGARLAVITDTNVWAAQRDWLNSLGEGFEVLRLPAGEKSKSLKALGEALDFLAAQRLDRGGLLVAAGGGVVGDLAGFAAASYLRGIRFIQVPTTLLAMVDSSVGGKTGINISAGKNLVGAFHQPLCVYADIDLMGTMPQREFFAGMAEVLKYSLLQDGELFAQLEAKPILGSDDPRLEQVVERNCRTKAAVVKADERETASTGGRALLNLGHTFGHAIENVAGYGEYLHGEAVAVGLVAAAMLSCELGFIAQGDVARIQKAVSDHRLPTRLASPLPVERLLAAMRLDKKVKAGVIRFVILKEIGKAETLEHADMELVRRIWIRCGAGD